MQVGEAFITVRPDTSKFGPEMTRDVERSGRQAGSALSAALAGGIAVAGISKVIGSASELEQAIGGTTAVFGEAGAAIEEFAKTSADSVGLSESSYRSLASFAGNQLKGLGFSAQEAAEQTNILITMGADLAATFGGTTQEAVQALSATFRGEYDPVERYVAGLRASTVAAKAVEMGLATSGGAISNYARGQATLALLTEGAADAQGQFAEEADTAAGAQARAAAAAENTSASIGSNFLPVYRQAVTAVTVLAEAFGALPGPLQTGVLALGGYIALRGPLTAAFASMGTSVATLGTQLSGLSLAGAGIPGLFIATALGIAAVGDALSTTTQTENFVTDLAEGADINEVASQIANLNTEVQGYGRAGAMAHVTTEEIERIVAAVAEVDPTQARELAAELERLGVDAEVVAAAIGAIPPLTPDEVAAQQAEDVADLAATYDELTDAVSEYLDLSQSQEEAAAGAAEAQQALFQSLVANGNTMDVNTEKGRENIANRNEWIDTVGDQVIAAIGFAESGGNVEVAQRRANNAIKDGIGDLRGMRDAGLITQAQFREYSGVLRAIPHRIDSELRADGSQGRREVDNTRAHAGRFWDNRRFVAQFDGDPSGAQDANAAARRYGEDWEGRVYTAHFDARMAGGIPGQAAGGDYRAGQAFLVGERGPELRVEGHSGHTYTAAQTAGILSNSSGSPLGGGVTVIVEGNVVGDIERFADEIAYRAAEKLSMTGGF